MPDLNTWVLLAIALTNALTALLVWHTKDAVKVAQADIAATKVAVELTERNTNSMKDALVARTAEASFAAGSNQARIVGEVKAAALVENTKK